MRALHTELPVDGRLDAEGAMDAIDLLEEQHRRLAELFAGVVDADSPGHRTHLLAHLVRALDAHNRVEGAVFYAAFVQRTGGCARLYEGAELHTFLDAAASNLLRLRVTDVRFVARLKLVEDLFHRHVALEEDWMFPKAKRALHDETLERIGRDIARAHGVRMVVGADRGRGSEGFFDADPPVRLVRPASPSRRTRRRSATSLPSS